MTDPLPLSLRLREACKDLHLAAERSPAMHALLRGRLSRDTYCVLLRGLQEVYDALESALAENPVGADFPLAGLRRRDAIAADLAALRGASDPDAIPVPPAAEGYASHITSLAATRPDLLLAHAYVRYLGDLSGGQILRPAVRRSIGDAVALYDFGDDATVRQLKDSVRVALDETPRSAAAADQLIAEAQLAYEHHLLLFADLDDLGSNVATSVLPRAE